MKYNRIILVMIVVIILKKPRKFKALGAFNRSITILFQNDIDFISSCIDTKPTIGT